MKIMRTLTLLIYCPLLIIFLSQCSKKNEPGSTGNNGPSGSSSDSIYLPVDPSLAGSIGFFGDSWKPKTFTTPFTTGGAVPNGNATDSLKIDVNKVLVKVPATVYGNNSNLWMGQMITQNNLMQYISDLSPNIIRAPAGSVSDMYFWNGTTANPAPADAPATLPDANGNSSTAGYWYGGNTQSWTLSLNNYYQMLANTNSTGIITVNYGYARYGTSANPVATAAHLAADWVRFDKGRTKYWEIGNETYGNWEAGYRIDLTKNKDGQPEYITGSLYGQHIKIFIDSMRAAAKETGATIYIGATLYDKPAAAYDYTSIQTWNQGVFTSALNIPDFYIVHDYFTAYNSNSSITEILNSASTIPNTVMSYLTSIENANAVIAKPIALTEWNTFAVGSKQNTSFIGGMHAAKALGNIIKNNFGEASRWDLANGWNNGDDMGLFNIGDEPGAPLWNPRPAFYYQYYFKQFFGDRMVTDTLKSSGNDLVSFSSTFSSGQAGTILINSGTASHLVAINFEHFPAGSKYYWNILTGGTDNNGFSGQVFVNGNGPSTASGGPLSYATLKSYTAPLSGTIKINLPPYSVLYLVADKK